MQRITHGFVLMLKKTTPLLRTRFLFQNCSTSEMVKYCLVNNKPFQSLFIVNNTPRHSPRIDDLHTNIKVVFPPPYTTSLIQSLDQGIIADFKTYHLRKTFAQATAATKEDTVKTLMQF